MCVWKGYFNFKYEEMSKMTTGMRGFVRCGGYFKYLNRPQESDYVNGISYTRKWKKEEVEKVRKKM